MKPPVETVRISQQGKEKLLAANRRFGFENWNVPSRIAFLIAVKSEFEGFGRIDHSSSGIEMHWKTFSGDYDAEFCAIAYNQFSEFRKAGAKISIQQWFHEMLHQGILMLSNKEQFTDLRFIAECRQIK